MSVHRVVRRVTVESAGQVLPSLGASGQFGPRTASARSRLLARRDLRTARQPGRRSLPDLVFFHGATAAVVSHGLVKERVVPPKEIDHAIEHKKRFETNPAKHTYEEA